MNKPTEEEVKKTVEVLSWFNDEIKDGTFDGWGMDNDFVLAVKHWLESIVLEYVYKEGE